MKRLALILVLVFAGLASISAADYIYVFKPVPNKLWELPHDYYFTWGINFNLAPDEIITGATLTYENIWNWRKEKNNLYTTLLDNPRTGVVTYLDYQGGGNNFAGQGTFAGDWSDLYGGYPRNFDLVYDFEELGLLDVLNEYINTPPSSSRRANFGFGIDPDCHYYNDGIKFVITTTVIPEPATIAILGLGVIFLIRRRK
ncbi:MAG: PEP-CTERM sorting domain-containing protein [Phycisphaerae bacterium]